MSTNYRNTRFEDLFYELKDIQPNIDKLESVFCFCGVELYKPDQLTRHIAKVHPEECESKRRRLELLRQSQAPLVKNMTIPDYQTESFQVKSKSVIRADLAKCKETSKISVQNPVPKVSDPKFKI